MPIGILLNKAFLVLLLFPLFLFSQNHHLIRESIEIIIDDNKGLEDIEAPTILDIFYKDKDSIILVNPQDSILTICSDINNPDKVFEFNLESEEILIYPGDTNSFSCKDLLNGNCKVRFVTQYYITAFNNIRETSIKTSKADEVIKEIIEKIIIEATNSMHLERFRIYEANIDTMGEFVYSHDEIVNVTFFYDKDFFQNLDEKSKRFVVLHEIGHLEIGKYHSNSKKIQEEKADEFAALEFRKLYPRISWNQFKDLLTKGLFKDYNNDSIYPSREARMLAIKKGWELGSLELNQRKKSNIKRFERTFYKTLKSHTGDFHTTFRKLRTILFDETNLSDMDKNRYRKELGKKCVEYGLYDEAQVLLAVYLELAPDDIEIEILRLICKYRSQDEQLDRSISKHLEQISNSKTLEPEKRSFAAYVFGKMLKDNDSLQKAIHYLDIALDLDRTYVDAYGIKADIYGQLWPQNVDSLLASSKFVNQAINMEPLFGVTHSEKVSKLIRKRKNILDSAYKLVKTRKSKRLYDRLWKMDPSYCKSQTDFMLNWTMSAYMTGAYNDAVKNGERVLRKTSTSENDSNLVRAMIAISQFSMENENQESRNRLFEEALYRLHKLSLQQRLALKIPKGLDSFMNEPFKASIIAKHYIAALEYEEDPTSCQVFSSFIFLNEPFPENSHYPNPNFDDHTVQAYEKLKGRKRTFEQITQMNTNKKRRVFCSKRSILELEQ